MVDSLAALYTIIKLESWRLGGLLANSGFEMNYTKDSQLY